MKTKKTNRGFSNKNFTDRNGVECSIQQSSLATEEAIWFGIDKPKLTIFADKSYGKYETMDMPELYMVDSRMHLTRKQLKKLLPTLIKFVETGEL